MSIKEGMAKARLHLRTFCVSLSFVRSGYPSPEHWLYGTGFLLKIAKKTIIVTAGHFAEAVHDHKEKGTLVELHLRYHHVSGDLITKTFFPEEITNELLQAAPDFDAAIFRVSCELAAHIEKQGNHFFTPADFMRGTTSVQRLAIVCGYPFQGNIVTKNPAFVTQQNGQLWQHNQVKLGSIAFQMTIVAKKGDDNFFIPVGFDCEVDEHRLRLAAGEICSDANAGITSAVGMSGGPVIAIAQNAENAGTFLHPLLLGMQASQKAIEWKERIEITELVAVSSTRLLAWILSTI